jgi:hypothetical protein
MAFIQFSGVTYHDPSRVDESYVLYSAADGVTRLIDLDGAVRNEWPFPGVPARIIDPALNGGRIGDVGVQLSQLDGSPGGIYGNRTIGQLSWTGEKLWEWGTEAPGGAARQNHDWELLANGNRLVLVTIPREVPELGPHVVGDQGIYEVAPDGAIVWQWSAGDHLSEFGFSAEGSTIYAAPLHVGPMTSGAISSSTVPRPLAQTVGTAKPRERSFSPTTS